MQTLNITQTYIDEDDPWLGILAAGAFGIISTTNRLKVYITDQLLFGRGTILPIKHKVYWGLIYQKKYTQVNKDNNHENIKLGDHDKKIGDKIMLNNHA